MINNMWLSVPPFIVKSTVKLNIPQTNIRKFFSSSYTTGFYEKLSIKNKCRVLDLLYEPNGYTIIGFTKKAFEKLSNERLRKNFIKI